MPIGRCGGGGNERTCNDQVQPAANLLRKHWKSLAFNAGKPVLPSQLAYGLAVANEFKKHCKSLALRRGLVVLPSQLG